ncbi:hypothetical protein FRX31_011477 [Thalictrum thalictroides]|uniref:Uncharacterized protein n=1 Tax=Thalictrum thalictroides TaxID=46969 RepID=A0A7J6WNH6_THATH|nr:hypothetical protein FRX31_011477 [Thalictrum thalictroides]
MESMETERRRTLRRRKPLSDCTNLLTTPTNRNTINKPQSLSIPKSSSRKPNVSTTEPTENIALNPRISPQTSTSPLNLVDVNYKRSKTPIVHNRRKPVAKVKEKGIHKNDDNLENPETLRDSSQRKSVAQVKEKGIHIADLNYKHPETPIDDIQRKHVAKGKEKAIHTADVNCEHPETPIDGSQRKHIAKGKEKVIHIADVTCKYPETPIDDSRRKPVAKGKDKGIRILDVNCKNPVTPIDYSSQRKLIAKEKEKGKAVAVASYSCPPLGRIKSIGDQLEKEKHNMHKRNTEQSGLAVPECCTASPTKKRRHSMSVLPQEFVEEKKAYYDTIDAFELEVDVVSESESE